MKPTKNRSLQLHEESDLKKEHERMAYVIRALGGGIWDFNVISGALSCSRRWHEILGLNYDTQRVLTIDQFKDYIHPDDVDHATKIDLTELYRAIASDERYSNEFRIIHQDGAPRWIRSVATLIGDVGGELRAVGCITDITPMMAQHALSSLETFPPLGGAEHLPSTLHLAQPKQVTLSIHEKECLRWVSFGKTAKETASILGKSPRTIEFHLNKAIEKLGAVNKVQATFLAFQQRLI
ncbi:MAG: PAS domain-containing protein [Rhizomicrobium sp.]